MKINMLIVFFFSYKVMVENDIFYLNNSSCFVMIFYCRIILFLFGFVLVVVKIVKVNFFK